MGLRKGNHKRSGQKSLGQSMSAQCLSLAQRDGLFAGHCKGRVGDVWL